MKCDMCKQKKSNKHLFDYTCADVNYIFCDKCSKIINDSVISSIEKVKKKYKL